MRRRCSPESGTCLNLLGPKSDLTLPAAGLTLQGGKNRGLLVNSTDLCRSSDRGVAAFYGHNGRAHRLRTRVATAFKGCAKVRRLVARRTAARKQASTAAWSALRN